MLAFYLTHYLLFSKKMFYILPQSTRHRIQRPQSIFQFIGIWFTSFIIVSDILHHLFKSYIIRNISTAIGIGNL